MRKPTTINGYLSVIRMLQTIPVSTISGFNKLDDSIQQDMLELTASIDNIVNEWETNL